jgi:hypothetical protein
MKSRRNSSAKSSTTLFGNIDIGRGLDWERAGRRLIFIKTALLAQQARMCLLTSLGRGERSHKRPSSEMVD